MDFFNNLKLAGQRAKIAEKILKEIGDRLKFLVNVGLNYLTLSRSAKRSPAAKPNVFVWQARSAQVWSA